jgi:radical SAM protein with 4Fe4S-binding SPASM domain
LPKRFSLDPKVILRSEPQYYNTYAAFDYGRVRTELLTQDEHRILEHIYDSSSDASQISKRTGVNHKKCEKFLNRMSKLGYVQTNAGSSSAEPPERVKADPALFEQFSLPFLSAPTSVDLFITNRCNLNCVHCFSSRENQALRELSIEEVRSVLDQLEKLGVLELRISGGEPLLHPQIDEILMTLKDRRLRRVILTNGILLDEEKARLLKESGVTPTLSVDDSDAEGHDLFRGVKGSFQRTTEALRLLQENAVEYGINSCLHRRNLNNHRKIIELAVRYGASRIAFLDLKPSSRMKKNIEWCPSHSEYQEVLPELMLDRVRYKGKIDVALDTFLTCEPLEESLLEARRGYVCCQAGRNRLSIDSSGSIYPCNLVISDPKWDMGNMRSEELWKIWFSRKWSFFRGGVKVNDLRKCGDCEKLAQCRDFFCRLQPYLTNGDPCGPHPKCS